MLGDLLQQQGFGVIEQRDVDVAVRDERLEIHLKIEAGCGMRRRFSPQPIATRRAWAAGGSSLILLRQAAQMKSSGTLGTSATI